MAAPPPAGRRAGCDVAAHCDSIEKYTPDPAGREKLHAAICRLRLHAAGERLGIGAVGAAAWVGPVGPVGPNGRVDGTTAGEEISAADRAFCRAAAGAMPPIDPIDPSDAASPAAAVAAALDDLADLHERWRARHVEFDLPGVYYTPPALVDHILARLAALDGAVGSGTAPGPGAAQRRASRSRASARVFDPAVGCGAFLLGWLRRASVDRAGGRVLDAAMQLHGVDLDPVAAAIARVRILAACAPVAARGELDDLARRLAAQIWVGDGLAGEPPGEFDVVIGNPPFQFLSGRASPVAQLRRRELRRAAELAAAHARLTAQFPASSQGCRDLYKWFLDRASACLRPGGWLAMLTPNTWLYLAHFRDLRRLLLARTRIARIEDHGFGLFARPTLGAAVVYAERRREAAPPPAAAANDAAAIAFARREKGRWRRPALECRAGDFKVYRSAWARGLYRRGDLTTLGALATIAEGEHGIRRAGHGSQSVAAISHPVPIFEDAELRPLNPVPVRWWPVAAVAPEVLKRTAAHGGARVLLRKTGSGLAAAPAATAAFALAHQNVYVLKSRHGDLAVEWLALLLTAEAIQRLYREGPHGQPGRPLAQLRVAALQALPLPPLERILHAGAALSGLWQTRSPAGSTARARWQLRLDRLVAGLLAPAGPLRRSGQLRPTGRLRRKGSAVQ
ncbi:MAG: Eco57I restriction-modification methylase domain-containing protein [Planctomycetota bacterium]